jgi:hypothetical protein
MDARWDLRRQYTAYAALSLIAVGFTAFLLPASRPDFQRFIGAANPLLVVLGCALVGGLALGWLHKRYGFEIVQGPQTPRGIAVAAAIATLLAVAIVVADLFIRYAEDINIPMPRALLFYPAIGFVAEIVFHILPLALVLLLLTPFRSRLGENRVVWLAILIVAVTEPIFQVTFQGEPFTWGAAYTWLHVFVFALCQLAIFRRYDFMSMFAFRLVYYAYWHIAWGVLRLEVLF